MLRWMCLFAAIGGASPSWADDVHVADGDTIIIGGITFRLDGIDAPESDQRCLNGRGEAWACGLEAAKRLTELIAKRPVHCEDFGPDGSHQNSARRIGVCAVKGSVDPLNKLLVQDGWAVELERYAVGRFTSVQEDARISRRGLWASCFVSPSDHRRWRVVDAVLLGDCSQVALELARNRLFPESPDMPPGCTIKGKFAKRTWITGHSGIYHLESCRSYPITVHNQRWLCSEQEALNAGFRKAYTCPQ